MAVGFNPDEVGKEAEAYRAFLAQRTEFEAYMKLRVAQTITEHAIPEIDANAVNAYFELAEIITDDPSAINQVPQIIFLLFPHTWSGCILLLLLLLLLLLYRHNPSYCHCNSGWLLYHYSHRCNQQGHSLPQ